MHHAQNQQTQQACRVPVLNQVWTVSLHCYRKAQAPAEHILLAKLTQEASRASLWQLTSNTCRLLSHLKQSLKLRQTFILEISHCKPMVSWLLKHSTTLCDIVSNKLLSLKRGFFHDRRQDQQIIGQRASSPVSSVTCGALVMEITDSEEVLSFNALCLGSESTSPNLQLPITLTGTWNTWDKCQAHDNLKATACHQACPTAKMKLLTLLKKTLKPQGDFSRSNSAV